MHPLDRAALNFHRSDVNGRQPSTTQLPAGRSKEEEMRSLLLIATTIASLAMIVLTISPAHSITISTPTGVRQATGVLHLTEAAHCRRYAHRHRHGHAWSRGCRDEAVTHAPRRAGLVGRPGGRIPNAAPGGVVTAPTGRSPGNYFNPNNPQDRSGNFNRQDMTQPRAFNPQDMR
jgi:hypothetical protein